MAADEKWYFTKEQLASTPSRKCGFDADRELSCRQQAANFIQDMGQRLQVTQLCINTAIVYMHRFYVFHSFTHFHRHAMAAAALFLAAKVEEQPRKLEHVIKVTQICLHRDQPHVDIKSEQYLEQAQDLVFNENVLLQTLGFDVAIDHPHTHVVRCCHLVRASKDLAQTSYFMASNSLHLTTMCLQYKPTVVACFCIHLACKWSNWEIPQSNEGKYWFYYVDRTVTQELLEQLTAEFLVIFDKCPSRLKRKIMSANQNPSNNPTPYSQFDKLRSGDPIEGVSFQSQRPQDPNKASSSQTLAPSTSTQRTDLREYQEKRDRERQLVAQSSASQHRDGHHRSHHPAHPPATSSATAPHKAPSAPPYSNKPPHPVQQHHRPPLPHHSRTDHTAKQEHPSRSEHVVKPEHLARLDHPNRPDPSSRPDHQSRPEHLTRPDHPSRPEHLSRPDHLTRTDHPTRQDLIRSDHQNRLDHTTRPDHPSRPDHISRPDHTSRPDNSQRPDHQSRPEHPSRPDHQNRSDHMNRPDHQNRPDQVARPDHQNRPEHINRPERHERSDRPDGLERPHQAEQRHSGVTAARDQARREAAMLREASRRDPLLHLPTNLMNHSPAQRTTSQDSGISVGSSGGTTTLTLSSQERPSTTVSTSVSATAVPSAPSVPVLSGSKYVGQQDSTHRHSAGHEIRIKSNHPVGDVYTSSRHRSSLPGGERRPQSGSNNSSGTMKDVSSGKQTIVPYNNQQPSSNRHRKPHENLLNAPPTSREDTSSLSLDRKMMQEISERRQLESFFGKTEALERLSEKHQSKQTTPLQKEIKREHDAQQVPPQYPPPTIPQVQIKRERSPSRQMNLGPPPVRVKAEPPSPGTASSLHNSNKSLSSQPAQLMKTIKAEIPEEDSQTRNGTTVQPLLTPKVEKVDKIEAQSSKQEMQNLQNKPLFVKSSIFSPEKTAPKERESPFSQRDRVTKTICPPSPGIAFGSPPVTPGKSQSTSSRNRTSSSCSDSEPVVELTKIDKEPGFENVLREGRIHVRNSMPIHHSESVASVKTPEIRPSLQTPSSKASLNPTDTRPSPQTPARGAASALETRSPVQIPTGKASSSVPEVRTAVSISNVRSPVNRLPAPSSEDRPIPQPLVGKPSVDSGAIAFPPEQPKEVSAMTTSEEGSSVLPDSHHHHKSKKKKEKKEKHKHKDKDKDKEKDKEKHREEKKHKSKHKEKDKERRKAEAVAAELGSQSSNQSLAPIKLTIPKVNITPPPAPQSVAAAPSSGGGLKLKINLSQISASAASLSSAPKESRKRDRDRSSPGSEQSTPKVAKMGSVPETSKRASSSNYNRQNGLESRGGRHHGQQQQHYTPGSKVVTSGSSSKTSEMSKGSSSHPSTS